MSAKPKKSVVAHAGVAAGIGMAANDARVVAFDGRDLEVLNKQRTAAATAALRAERAKRVERAHRLRQEGLSAARIGIKMAGEDKKPEPYPERTVRRWLSDVVPKKG